MSSKSQTFIYDLGNPSAIIVNQAFELTEGKNKCISSNGMDAKCDLLADDHSVGIVMNRNGCKQLVFN